ncbi:MAG: hypothetical protein NVS1B13_05070 [Flavisolibacter sp.]
MAQSGYEIKVTLKPFKNQYLYLGHYYGRQLPIIDSVKLNSESQGIFKGKKSLGGGIYLIGFPDRARNFEILVDKEQHFSIVADSANLPAMRFYNSPDNTLFKAYQDYMAVNGKGLETLYKKRKGSSAPDSLKLTQKIEALNGKILQYRLALMAKAPKSFLTTLLKAMREPEVPKNESAYQKDSLYSYHYFKNHYWDHIQFYDDRWVRTPFFEPKLDKYFEQLVYPNADSVIKEIDYMLGFASINEEMQRFLLLKFVNRYLNQKYMWEDAVFVHLFEQYFAQKNYAWLTDKGKKLISDRAYSLMANILGNPAPEISLADSAGHKINLYSVEAPYVLVVIWDPTCSHCKETLPKIDSMYRQSWKEMGMKIFGLAKQTDGSRQDWINFININNLNQWVNVYYSKQDDQTRVNSGTPGYTQLYDVQSFPTLYLLDKDKHIIAKKISFEQVAEILQHRLKNQ